jgi:UDP-3-O-[3-hydroxymyristoyl] glucosamine N-acyltransferase
MGSTLRLREFVALCRGDLLVNREGGGMLGAASACVFRLGQLSVSGAGVIAATAAVLYIPLDLIYMKLLIGADIPRHLECGPRLRLAHGGRGVFVHPAAKLGSGITIQQQVTVGIRTPTGAAPVIGDDVLLGVKSSVLGPVTVGAGSRVGAHALVIDNVPPHITVVGVPARPVSTRTDDRGE